MNEYTRTKVFSVCSHMSVLKGKGGGKQRKQSINQSLNDGGITPDNDKQAYLHTESTMVASSQDIAATITAAM